MENENPKELEGTYHEVLPWLVREARSAMSEGGKFRSAEITMGFDPDWEIEKVGERTWWCEVYVFCTGEEDEVVYGHGSGTARINTPYGGCAIGLEEANSPQLKGKEGETGFFQAMRLLVGEAWGEGHERIVLRKDGRVFAYSKDGE